MFSNIIRKSFNLDSEKKSYDYNCGSLLLEPNLGWSASQNQSQFVSYYLKSSPIFTALKLLSDNISSIKPVLYDRKKDKFIYEHDLLRLLNKPNPFTNGELFMTSIVNYFKLTGNIYINVIGSSKPVELEIFKPTDITIQSGSRDNYPEEYSYNSNTIGLSYKRDNKNLFVAQNGNQLGHMRNFNPYYGNNNLFGVSDLAACELEISQYLLASIHNNSLIQNQARPSGLLVYKGSTEILQDSLDEMKRDLKANLAGAANAGKATFLNGDFDWKQMSESIKDMDFATLKKQTATAIYNALKIPLPMVSPDNMTLANMDSAKFNFYDNAILPLRKTIDQFLSELLLPRYPNSENLSLTFDPASIEALRTRQVDEALKLSKSGVLTINEIRRRLGESAATEGGDEIYQPMNLVPIASDQYTDDNRDVPAKRKAVFIKTMIDGGYSEDVINKAVKEYYGNNQSA
jgi:HK97 family phage portal protein